MEPGSRLQQLPDSLTEMHGGSAEPILDDAELGQVGVVRVHSQSPETLFGGEPGGEEGQRVRAGRAEFVLRRVKVRLMKALSRWRSRGSSRMSTPVPLVMPSVGHVTKTGTLFRGAGHLLMQQSRIPQAACSESSRSAVDQPEGRVQSANGGSMPQTAEPL